MTIAVLILAAFVMLAMVLLYRLIPRDGCVILGWPGGGGFVFSRSGISLLRAPDYYFVNGFDHIEPYVTRLLASPATLRRRARIWIPCAGGMH